MRRRSTVAALLGSVMLTGCRDATDVRVWTSSALFLQRDTARSLPVDTSGLPADAVIQLRAAGVDLGGAAAGAHIRFIDVRAAGGGIYEVDARIAGAGAARGLRLFIECRSRHCLVIDTAAL